jgi:hypothetical protein
MSEQSSVSRDQIRQSLQGFRFQIRSGVASELVLVSRKVFLAVACSVNVEQPANHFLVLGAVLSRFLLEEVHAGFAQSNSHFDAFLAERQFLGRGQKVLNNTQLA